MGSCARKGHRLLAAGPEGPPSSAKWPGRCCPGVWELRLGFCKGSWGRGCQEEERPRLWKSGPVGGGGRGREEERAGPATGCTSGTRQRGAAFQLGSVMRTGGPPSDRGVLRRQSARFDVGSPPQTPGRRSARTVGTRVLKFRKEGRLGHCWPLKR